MKGIFAITVTGILMCGCSKTHYVPVENVRTEYVDKVKVERVTDSVFNDRLVYIAGDTVYIREWRDRWRTETTTDTVLIEKTDTIRIPYPVEKTVEAERKRRWWETALIWTGISAIFGVILLLYCYFSRVTKIRTH